MWKRGGWESENLKIELLMKRYPMIMNLKDIIIGIAKLGKAVYRFNIISCKNPKGFSCRNERTDPQSHMRLQGNKNSQNNLEKDEQSFQF